MQKLKARILPSSGLLLSVGWFRTDISRLHTGPIFLDDRPFMMGGTGSPEMSVLNQPTLSSNPEDGRIQFNRGGSLRSRKLMSYFPFRNKFA